jgi:peptidylprolyl isomerase
MLRDRAAGMCARSNTDHAIDLTTESVMRQLLACVLLASTAVLADDPPKAPTMAGVLAASKPADWRALDPQNTLYLELPGGRVVIELAPDYAPNHVANIRKLAQQHYFDGLAIVRSQENYVVQWGDPEEDEARRKPFGEARTGMPAEFDRAFDDKLPFTPVPDGDVYAPQAGLSGGFPVARDPATKRAWLAHCYAMVGAGRGDTTDSGSGAELYVVIGHSPRHLDRNVTLVGRVVQGMEVLTLLPRGTGPLGFYEKAEQRVPIRSLRLAADVPEAERAALEIMRTDTESFRTLIEARRTRRESWFVNPTGRIEMCNVPVPVRPVAKAPANPAK